MNLVSWRRLLTSTARQSRKQVGPSQPFSEPRKVSQTPTPAIKRESPVERRLSNQPVADDKPGTDYPARHASKLDLNGNPVLPSTGKPALATDFDVDFPTESSKPWRKPGADMTDYFNYGFDEFTWASYCLKQQQMPKEIKEINSQAEQMKAFVEGIPGGGMPGVPPMGPAAGGAGGMPSMPGMPSESEMGQMFQQMMTQGVDPSNMDFSQFMQMMNGGGGAGGQQFGGQAGGFGNAGGPPQQPGMGFNAGGGYDQGTGGGGHYGGRGRGRGRGRY